MRWDESDGPKPKWNNVRISGQKEVGSLPLKGNIYLPELSGSVGSLRYGRCSSGQLGTLQAKQVSLKLHYTTLLPSRAPCSGDPCLQVEPSSSVPSFRDEPMDGILGPKSFCNLWGIPSSPRPITSVSYPFFPPLLLHPFGAIIPFPTRGWLPCNGM